MTVGNLEKVTEDVGGYQIGIQPGDPGITTEPCPLSPGESSGPTYRLVQCLLQIGMVIAALEGIQMGRQLPVPKGLSGGPTHRRAGPKRAHLIEEAVDHLTPVPPFDPVGHHRLGQSDTHHPNRRRREGVQTRAERRERATAAQAHLQSPYHPSTVRRFHPFRRPRVEIGEATVKHDG